MFGVKLGLFVLLATSAFALPAQDHTSPSKPPPPPAKPIILRNLASPRFFGAAANTTFLFNDANYTKVISTQVSDFWTA